MENYIVSARKYRPSTFDSVVGQRALTTTLKNAIATGKLAHAYLFCGPRGVGKTTCARIFAKTINCLHPTPDGEPCNECESCRAFNEQRSYNIHELDAASNNSVDDIRQLVEQVRVPPQIGKYKVYIIDEVHMLSTSAFNAFLKTLEEPPYYAIFILATTEKHKILPTILSRCQIYDFNRISVDDIVAHLAYVASKEGVKAEPEALNVIALKADGGMRDALSVFDQVASFSGGNITYRSTIENLNVLDYEYYFRLTDSLLDNKVSDVLLLLDEVLNKGFDGSHFVTGLTAHLRDLLVCKDPATVQLLEVGAGIRQRYMEQAQKCPVPFLFRAMKLSNECDLNYRLSKNKRLLVELMLIELAQLTSDTGEASGGAPPAHTLKPIASGQSAAPARSADASSAQPVRNSSAKPVQAPSASPSSAPVHAIPTVLEQAKGSGEKKIPVMDKSALGFSIRHTAEAGNAPKPVSQPVARPPETEEDRMFNEKDLNYYWREYANRLPHEQVAIAKRMMNMRVTLSGKTSFEVVVNNEIVYKDFTAMIPSIQDYLRASLKNRNVTMTVRISTPDEKPHVAYSRAEKFQMMAQKNKALLQLKDTLGLEFY